MYEYDWAKLTHLQIGRYAEYLVKMELVRHGLDVYSSEVDNKGIDLVLRSESGNKYYDVQVKSVFLSDYIFLSESKFDVTENRLVAVVRFYAGREPEMFLIPATAWNEPNDVFVFYPYDGKKSEPEWGIRLNKKSDDVLEAYTFGTVIESLIDN